jgi:hypothetical protein
MFRIHYISAKKLSKENHIASRSWRHISADLTAAVLARRPDGRNVETEPRGREDHDASLLAFRV